MVDETVRDRAEVLLSRLHLDIKEAQPQEGE
jgi:hypothetical protein